MTRQIFLTSDFQIPILGSQDNPSPAAASPTIPLSSWSLSSPHSHMSVSAVKIPATMSAKTAPSHGMVFSLIQSKDRASMVKMVMQEDFTLGVLDQATGRLIFYY